jgi:hypothetical protein
MSTFASAAALPSVMPLDPTKHVKFTRGMVLGVDDFDQEFAYLSGRDRWAVRDLIGYGVVSGLRLYVEPPPAGEEDKGPRIGVSAGVAALPSGQLVCVSPAQCAFVGEWVRAHREELEGENGSPPDEVRAAVVLCYAECETDDVPIPGEPCRSEENLMAPSRVKDHFSLELRVESPVHLEDEAVRRFAAWLALVPFSESDSDLDDFLEDLRQAGSEEAGSPPTTDEFLDEPPPPGLSIPRHRAPEFLEAAFGLWVSTLRARWRSRVPGCECAPGPGCPPDDDCLLLGEAVIPATWDSISGEVLVGDADEVELDLSRRPTLVHLRLLQEWLLAGAGRSEAAQAVIRLDTSPPEVVGEGIEVEQVDDRVFHLVPAGFDAGAAYAVTGTGIAAVADPSPLTLELLDPSDPDLATLLAGAGIAEPGVTVRVQSVGGDPPSRGFVVQIERIGGAS